MKKIMIVAAALLLSSTAANAITLTWDVSNSSFSGTVGGTSLSSGSTGPGNEDAFLRWGTSLGSGQSGYDWNGIDGMTDIFNGDTVGITFGEFTHINKPIAGGSSITGTNLNFTFEILGVSIPVNISLAIQHNETPNVGGGNCCNDIVTNTTYFSQSFDAGGLTGYLTILPFTFETVEGASTTKQFQAFFSYNVAPPPPPDIPVPMAAPLFLSGMAGIGVLARRRKAKQTA